MVGERCRSGRPAEEQPRHNVPVARTVVMLNLLLAAVVLAKDLLLASYLGVSWQADAFFLAFFLPDAIGSNILATALATALVPALVAMRGTGTSWRIVVRRYALPTFLVSVLLAGLTFWLQEPLLALIAAKQSDGVGQTARVLLGLILPVMLLYPLTAVASAVLQAHQRFLLAALAPVIQNGIMLAALGLLLWTATPLSSGIFLAAAALSLAALSALLAIGWGAGKLLAVSTPLLPADQNRPERPPQRLLSWLLIASSTQLTLLGERFWAGRLGEGTVSALNYAYRLAQFPLWTFVSALAMVTLPSLSRQAIADRSKLSDLARDSLLLALLLTIPTGLALSLLAKPIVSLLMQHGNFGPSSVQQTAQVLTGYALSLAPAAIVLLGQRFFLAMGQLLIPASCCLLISVITLTADGWLVAAIGPGGLGYGATLGTTLSAVLTLYLLRRAGLSLGSFLRSQATRLLRAHLPFALAVSVSALAWPLLSEQGPAARLGWLLANVLLLPSCWIFGLARADLLQPVLAFLGVGRPEQWRFRRFARREHFVNCDPASGNKASTHSISGDQNP